MEMIFHSIMPMIENKKRGMGNMEKREEKLLWLDKHNLQSNPGPNSELRVISKFCYRWNAEGERSDIQKSVRVDKVGI